MSKRLVPFVFYTKPNLTFLAPLLSRLKNHRFFSPLLVKGFDYEEYVGKRTPIASWEGVEVVSVDDHKVREAEGWMFPEKRDLPLERLYRKYDWAGIRSKMASVRCGLEDFILQRKPSLAILPEDTDYIRGCLASEILGDRGVHKVVLMAPYYDRFASYPLLGPPRADFYFTFNPQTRERLLLRGVSANRIHVLPQAKIHRRLRPREEGFILFFPLQNREWERAIAKDLVRLIQTTEMELWIKQHPEETNSRIEEVLAGHPRIKFVENPIAEILPLIDCVVTQNSSVLVEAEELGIPSILVNYSGFPGELLLPNGFAKGRTAHNLSELTQLVENIRQKVFSHFELSSSRIGEEALEEILSYLGDQK